jgi:hypothetical protein
MVGNLPASWIEDGMIKNQLKLLSTKIKKNVYGFEGEINSSEQNQIDPVPVRLWEILWGQSK